MQNQQRQQKKVPAAVKNYVKTQLATNIELNKLDTFGQFTVAPTIAPLAMNLIPSASREGEVVHMESVRLAYTLTVGTGATITQFVRCIVFEWKPLTVPTQADILETLVATSIINSPHRFTTREFYRVISDQVFGLTPNAATSTHVVQREYKAGMQKKRFDDAAVPAKTVGLMYVLWVSDEATVAQPTLNYNVRTRFTDA